MYYESFGEGCDESYTAGYDEDYAESFTEGSTQVEVKVSVDEGETWAWRRINMGGELDDSGLEVGEIVQLQGEKYRVLDNGLRIEPNEETQWWKEACETKVGNNKEARTPRQEFRTSLLRNTLPKKGFLSFDYIKRMAETEERIFVDM